MRDVHLKGFVYAHCSAASKSPGTYNFLPVEPHEAVPEVSKVKYI